MQISETDLNDFDLCLVRAYQQAVQQKYWTVAEHLLSAIEACAELDGEMNDVVG